MCVCVTYHGFEVMVFSVEACVKLGVCVRLCVCVCVCAGSTCDHDSAPDVGLSRSHRLSDKPVRSRLENHGWH